MDTGQGIADLLVAKALWEQQHPGQHWGGRERGEAIVNAINKGASRAQIAEALELSTRRVSTLVADQLERYRRELEAKRNQRLTEALTTLIRYAREVDIQAAIHHGGVDVRAPLGPK